MCFFYSGVAAYSNLFENEKSEKNLSNELFIGLTLLYIASCSLLSGGIFSPVAIWLTIIPFFASSSKLAYIWLAIMLIVAAFLSASTYLNVLPRNEIHEDKFSGAMALAVIGFTSFLSFVGIMFKVTIQQEIKVANDLTAQKR